MHHILGLVIIYLTLNVALIECCTSFYCINSCGGDYKLILANNRDEDVYRLTRDAQLWPKRQRFSSPDSNVYGALDLKNGGI